MGVKAFMWKNSMGKLKCSMPKIYFDYCEYGIVIMIVKYCKLSRGGGLR